MRYLREGRIGGCDDVRCDQGPLTHQFMPGAETSLAARCLGSVSVSAVASNCETNEAHPPGLVQEQVQVNVEVQGSRAVDWPT